MTEFKLQGSKCIKFNDQELMDGLSVYMNAQLLVNTLVNIRLDTIQPQLQLHEQSNGENAQGNAKIWQQ